MDFARRRRFDKKCQLILYEFGFKNICAGEIYTRKMRKTMKRKKNSTLNALKGLACFSVVMLHCSFPGLVGKLIYGIARFAVPLFFAISGYYVYSNDSEKVIQKLPQKIKHIGLMFFGTEILYFLWHCFQYSVQVGTIQGAKEWICSLVSVKNLIYFIVFQRTVVGDISWFLVALIICYFVTFTIAKKNIWIKTFPLIPLLFLINLFLGEVAPFFDIETQWYWCSNFLLLGFPCYALGYYIKINEFKITQALTKSKIKKILFLTVFLNLIERVVTYASQLFISNILFMFGCFVYCIKYPTKFKRDKLVMQLSVLGDKYSFGVYILHPIIRDIYGMIFEMFKLNNNMIILWIRPIIVFWVSILVAYIFALFVKRTARRC